MKKLFTVLFIFTANIMLAQGGGSQAPQTELNVQIFNNQSGATIDFIMEPVIGNNGKYSRIYLDDSNAICTFPTVSVSYVNTNYPNAITLTDVANYCKDNGWGYGLDVGNVSCSNVDSDGESFQSGLYKVTVKVNGVEKTNFFYDNRHNLFPSSPCAPIPGDFLRNDIGVRYDVDDNKLYYRSPPTNSQTPPPLNGWEEFIMSEVINWWEIATTSGNYDVSGFQTRYFAILNEPESVMNSPYLTWIAPNVTLPLDHFEVQRAWGSGAFITVYSTNGLSYHDQEITWDPEDYNNDKLVQYRIATVYYKPSIPYGFSNIRKIIAENILQKKNSFINNDDYSLSLEQNYPNPFNPTTTISYQVGKDGYVTLNVFNLLGEEVATLVDQQQQKGNYEVKFDAAGLTSGIYFYRISSNGIVLNKKSILTK